MVLPNLNLASNRSPSPTPSNFEPSTTRNSASMLSPSSATHRQHLTPKDRHKGEASYQTSGEGPLKYVHTPGRRSRTHMSDVVAWTQLSFQYALAWGVAADGQSLEAVAIYDKTFREPQMSASGIREKLALGTMTKQSIHARHIQNSTQTAHSVKELLSFIFRERLHPGVETVLLKEDFFNSPKHGMKFKEGVVPFTSHPLPDKPTLSPSSTSQELQRQQHLHFFDIDWQTMQDDDVHVKKFFMKHLTQELRNFIFQHDSATNAEHMSEIQATAMAQAAAVASAYSQISSHSHEQSSSSSSLSTHEHDLDATSSEVLQKSLSTKDQIRPPPHRPEHAIAEEPDDVEFPDSQETSPRGSRAAGKPKTPAEFLSVLEQVEHEAEMRAQEEAKLISQVDAASTASMPSPAAASSLSSSAHIDISKPRNPAEYYACIDDLRATQRQMGAVPYAGEIIPQTMEGGSSDLPSHSSPAVSSAFNGAGSLVDDQEPDASPESEKVDQDKGDPEKSAAEDDDSSSHPLGWKFFSGLIFLRVQNKQTKKYHYELHLPRARPVKVVDIKFPESSLNIATVRAVSTNIIKGGLTGIPIPFGPTQMVSAALERIFDFTDVLHLQHQAECLNLLIEALTAPSDGPKISPFQHPTITEEIIRKGIFYVLRSNIMLSSIIKNAAIKNDQLVEKYIKQLTAKAQSSLAYLHSRKGNDRVDIIPLDGTFFAFGVQRDKKTGNLTKFKLYVLTFTKIGRSSKPHAVVDFMNTSKERLKREILQQLLTASNMLYAPIPGVSGVAKLIYKEVIIREVHKRQMWEHALLAHIKHHRGQLAMVMERKIGMDRVIAAKHEAYAIKQIEERALSPLDLSEHEAEVHRKNVERWSANQQIRRNFRETRRRCVDARSSLFTPCRMSDQYPTPTTWKPSMSIPFQSELSRTEVEESGMSVSALSTAVGGDAGSQASPVSGLQQMSTRLASRDPSSSPYSAGMGLEEYQNADETRQPFSSLRQPDKTYVEKNRSMSPPLTPPIWHE